MLVLSFSSFQISNTGTSHSALPTFVTPSTPGHDFQGFTQGQYDSTSNPVRASDMTQSDAFSFVSNDTSWYNHPTHHSSQHYEPVLGGTSAGHSSPSTIGSNPSSYRFSMYVFLILYEHLLCSQSCSCRPYLNGHTKTSSSLLPPSNDSLHQWQNISPQLGPPSRSFSSIVTPSLPLTVESSVHSSKHGSDTCNQIRLSANQPYPVPNSLCKICHFYPRQCYCKPAGSSLNSSSPPLLTCLWLLDGIPCGFTGPLEALKPHCKSSHFSGPQDAQMKCHWKGCDYHKRDDPAVDIMRRDCMWRHISEVHLGMKRGT